MKPITPRIAYFPALLAVVLGAAGCSDQSRMNMYIDQIRSSGGTVGYVEADWIGDSTNHCGASITSAFVAVRLESPGSIGPSLNARITGVTTQYYYSDPTDGLQRGPVAGLAESDTNYRETLPANLVTSIPIPLVPPKVKAWASGNPIAGVATAAGGALIRRMVGLVTVSAEDATGKKLSATGRVSIYLADYGPLPAVPVPPALPAAGDECYPYIGDPAGYWFGYN